MKKIKSQVSQEILITTPTRNIRSADSVHKRFLDVDCMLRLSGSRTTRAIVICKPDCEVLPLGCEYKRDWFSEKFRLVTIYPYVRIKGRLIRWAQKRKHTIQ